MQPHTASIETPFKMKTTLQRTQRRASLITAHCVLMTLLTVAAQAATYTWTGAAPGNYWARVYARNSSGSGPNSEQISFH